MFSVSLVSNITTFVLYLGKQDSDSNNNENNKEQEVSDKNELILINNNFHLKEQIIRLEQEGMTKPVCSVMYVIKKDSIEQITENFQSLPSQSRTKSISNSRGSQNSMNIYLSNTGHLFDLNNLTKSSLNLSKNIKLKGDDYINSCSFYFGNDYQAICITIAGIIYNYTFSENFTIIKDNHQFTDISGHISGAIPTIIRSFNNKIMIGANKAENKTEYKAELYVLKELKTHYPKLESISDIIEIKPNIYIITGNNGFLINPLKTNQTIHKTGTIINSVVKLSIKIKKDCVYFAVGGKGIVSIYQLNADETVTLLKEKTRIPSSTCIIQVLKEGEKGKLFIGGNYNCNVTCVWDYIWNDFPQCFSIPNNNMDKIIDILTVNNPLCS